MADPRCQIGQVEAGVGPVRSTGFRDPRRLAVLGAEDVIYDVLILRNTAPPMTP